MKTNKHNNFKLGRNPSCWRKKRKLKFTLANISCATTSSTLVSPSPKTKKPTPAEIILSLLRKDAAGKYTNVFEILASPQVLKLGYEVIKSKPGNMVRGVTRETLDGITTE